MSELMLPDQVRWFDPLGQCKQCTKPATGVLRGPRNESYGPYCRPCGEKRLAAAKKDRARYEQAVAKAERQS